MLESHSIPVSFTSPVYLEYEPFSSPRLLPSCSDLLSYISCLNYYNTFSPSFPESSLHPLQFISSTAAQVTDVVTPLPETLQLLPISLWVKTGVYQWPKRSHVICLLWLLLLGYSAPATMASLVFPEHNKHAFASRPLHMMNTRLLPGCSAPDILTANPSPLPGLASDVALEVRLPW